MPKPITIFWVAMLNLVEPSVTPPIVVSGYKKKKLFYFGTECEEFKLDKPLKSLALLSELLK